MRGHGDRDDGHEQRRAGARRDPREDVPAELVGAEQVGQDGRLEPVHWPLRHGVEGRQVEQSP